jgi:hypothetical protein
MTSQIDFGHFDAPSSSLLRTKVFKVLRQILRDDFSPPKSMTSFTDDPLGVIQIIRDTFLALF